MIAASAASLSRPRAHLLLHLCVILWGFTAILGKSITIPALSLVFYRTLTVVAMVAAFRVLARRPLRLPFARALRLAGVGMLVGIHWLLFYGCIKFAGVAVAVICLSTLAFFTAIFEPIFFRKRAQPYELVLGGGAVVGVVLLLEVEGVGTPLGWAMGIGSSMFSAAFGTLNGKLTRTEEPELITIYELFGGFLLMSLFLVFRPNDFVMPWAIGIGDLFELIVLAVACTILPWMWSLRVLTVLSPYVVSLAVTLEPVYSMFLARAFWPDAESLSFRFYIGALVLLLLNVANVGLRRRFETTAR